MRHQRISQEESYLCRCSTTFLVDRKTTKKNGKCQTRISVREKIWKRTMVIYWSWFWEKVVLYWTDIEPGKYSLSEYDISKKLIHLLRHAIQVRREDDGAFQFWRIKDNLQTFLYCHHWSDDRWKKSMAGGGGKKKRYQYCTDSSGIILYLRALQGHSGRSLIDPTLQDNVIIPDGFFKYIYHVGCAINLHSIINSGLIAGGQNLSNRQTVFFLLVGPMDKSHKDLDTIDLNAPRHAQYMQKHGRISERSVLGRHQSCSEEKIEVLSDSIERDHSSRNTSSLLYSESC